MSFVTSALRTQNVVIIGGSGLVSLGVDTATSIDPTIDLTSLGIESYSMAFSNTGDLLFYCNNEEVRDRNGDVMPNGLLSLEAISTTQGSIVITDSNTESNTYYLLSLEQITIRNDSIVFDSLGIPVNSTGKTSDGRLILSSINMDENFGLGNVTATDLVIFDNLTEKLAVTAHSCFGSWIITHERNNNRFVSLHFLDGEVIDTVISNVGLEHPENRWQGEMTFSPDRTKLVAAGRGFLETFDFNALTGELSSPQQLFFNSTIGCRNCTYYSVTFSQDGQVLFATRDTNFRAISGGIVQAFDLMSSTPDPLFVGATYDLTPLLPKLYRTSDNRIICSYAFTNSPQTSLGVIENIDSIELVTFDPMGIKLPDIIDRLALPLDMVRPPQTIIEPILPQDTSSCSSIEIEVDLTEFEDITWSDGFTSDIRTINESGIFVVSVVDTTGCVIVDTLTVEISDSFTELLPSDTTFCNEEIVTFDLSQYDNVFWSDGSTESIRSVDTSGIFAVTVSDGLGCAISDTTIVTITESSQGSFLPVDTTLCAGDELTVDLSQFVAVLWSDGLSDPIRSIADADTYFVTVADRFGCEASDSLAVSLNDITTDFLPADTSVCTDALITVDLSQFASVFWSDGSIDLIREISDPGDYIVDIIDDMGCPAVDTFSIIPADDIDLLPDPIVLECVDGQLIQTLTIPQGASNILWSTGETTQTIEVSDPGIYTIEALISGCIVRDTIEVISVNDCIEPVDPTLPTSCNTYVPNALYPSSPSGNNAFRPVSTCALLDYNLDIFDRWGGSVYSSNNPEDGWDGSDVNPGIYVYTLSYRYDQLDRLITQTGTVTMIK